MPKEALEETEKQAEKAKEAQSKRVSHVARLPSGKSFQFQLPERLQKLQEQIEQESKAVEETEIKDESDLRIAIEHVKQSKRIQNEIEHELLKLQFYEQSWVFIREQLTKITEDTTVSTVAIFFERTKDDNWGITLGIIEPNGKIKLLEKPVIFNENPLYMTKVPKKKPE